MKDRMQYKLDDLKVDAVRKTVMREGERLDLSDLSWRVFIALIENAPKTVSYESLAQSGWNKAFVSADTMTQRIKVLRQALGDEADNPRYIATDRGVGYRLISKTEPISIHVNNKSLRPKILIGGLLILAMFLTVVFIMGDPVLVEQNTSNRVTAEISADDLAARGYEYLRRGTRDSNEQALSFFIQAQEIEPDHQRGLIGQSFAQSHRATKYDFGAQAALIAEALARKALALNVKNGGAWHALGFSLDAQGHIDEALRAYEQAIAINPDDHNAVSSAAYLLQVQGRLHEALVLEQSIMRKGKRSQFTFLQIASALHLAGFEGASQKWLARAETLTPETVFLDDLKILFFLSKGTFSQAKDVVEAVDGARSASMEALYGEALLALGEKDKALTAFISAMQSDQNEMEGAFQKVAVEIVETQYPRPIESHPLLMALETDREAGDQWPNLSISAAYIYSAAGENESAITHLTEAYRLGYRDYNRLQYSPFFKTLRATPSFQTLLQSMKKDVDIQHMLIKNDDRLTDLHAQNRK